MTPEPSCTTTRKDPDMTDHRTSADKPYVYDGEELTEEEQAAIIRAAERAAKGKTTAELFDIAETEYWMADRVYGKTDSQLFEMDRAFLRAATFDRLARESETSN